jgi:DNA polymerase III delta prime subunit
MECVNLDDNKESDDFTVKYAPTKIKEIVGCQRQVEMLSSWLKNYDTNGREHRAYLRQIEKTRKGKRTAKSRARKANSRDSSGSLMAGFSEKGKGKGYAEASCALMTGDHGCGKTSIIKAVLNSFNYKIRTVDFSKLTSRNIDSFTQSLLDCDGVYTFVNEQSDNTEKIRNGKRVPAKIAIIIDEVESVSSNNEKNLINTLLEINESKWKAPVIFISNNKHKKLITRLKKDCYHVRIREPEVDDMLNLLVRIGVGEGMQMEDESIAHSIIDHSGFDFRKMISMMQMLHKLYGSEQIDHQKLDSYLKYTDQRDVDLTIYQNTVKLFTEFKSIEGALRVFEGDKVNMPLMVHQNHFMAMGDYVKDKDAQLEVAERITNSLAIGDIIENYIYSDQNWGLQEVQGYYSCVIPSYEINQTVNTNQVIIDSKFPIYGPKKFGPAFPKDLNRTSTRKINFKNIKAASEFFTDMTVSDYIRASQLIRQLLEDGRVDECEQLIERYNLTHAGVMYVLKIDKIMGTKKTISKDIDKKVKKITVEPLVKSNVRRGKVPKRTVRKK